VPDEEKFGVFGRLTAQSGKRDDLIARLREAMRACDGRGLEFGSVNSVLDDPDAVWITQVWTTRDAHDTVTTSETLVSITASLMQLVSGTPEGCYGQVAYLHNGRR
jgi:hypothetical protein